MILLVSFISFSQEGTSSPYSFYGLGEMRFKGTAENRAMSGVSVFPDSIHANLQNPAFYSQLKRIAFTLGATYGSTTMKTNAQEANARRTTLDYLALAIPMGKFGAGFGIMPYTSVGYKIQTLPTQELQQIKRFTGTGGLNKAFLGGAYQINKNLSLGVEAGYFFGNIETSSIYSIANIQLGTRELNESTASGIGFVTGLSYHGKVGSKYQFSASATYTPEATINLSNERTIATIQFSSADAITAIDEVNVNVADTKVKLPSKFSVGAGFGEARKWLVGTEVTFQQSSNFGNRFNDINDATFENGSRYAVGGYYIPNYASFTDYWKRITYRGGLKYEETGLIINTRKIRDAGFSLGVGLPLGGTFSNMNIGFEYGKRGTRDAALVEENYINFTVGLSLNDLWFVKRKYD